MYCCIQKCCLRCIQYLYGILIPRAYMHEAKCFCRVWPFLNLHVHLHPIRSFTPLCKYANKYFVAASICRLLWVFIYIQVLNIISSLICYTIPYTFHYTLLGVMVVHAWYVWYVKNIQKINLVTVSEGIYKYLAKYLNGYLVRNVC